MTSDTPLPGKTRVVDTVLGGRLTDRTLYIDARFPEACADLWAAVGCTQLGISEHENPGLADVSFLAAFPPIQKLHVLLDRKVDLGPLVSHAATLKVFFSNDDVNLLPDLSPFQQLTSLGQKWSAKTVFPLACDALERLSLVGFNPTSEDLSSLPAASRLNTLSLFKTKVQSLQGLGRYPDLATLRVTSAPRLADISALAAHSALAELAFEKCPSLLDFDAAVAHEHLSKLEYIGCAALPSLNFVRHLPRLATFVFLDTDVHDGNMQPLLDHPVLQHVAFTRKKHFSHAEAPILNALRSRRDHVDPSPT